MRNDPNFVAATSRIPPPMVERFPMKIPEKLNNYAQGIGGQFLTKGGDPMVL